MKKCAVLLTVGTLLLTICSCSFRASLDDGTVSFTVEGKPPAADSAGTSEEQGSLPAAEAQTAPGEASLTEAAEEEGSGGGMIIVDNFMADDYVPADGYVTLCTLDTGLGNVVYPVFNERMLDKEDARAANALFERIRDALGDNVKEFLELEGSDTGVGPVYDLSAAEYAVSNNILSVMMRYEYYFGYPVTHFCAVNFDTLTGKAVPANEVIETFSYTNDEVEAALLKYTETVLRSNKMQRDVFDCYFSGTVPEQTVFSEDRSDLYSIVTDGWRADTEPYSDIETRGVPWENLPLYPYVYVNDMSQLFAVGRIPAGPDSDIYNVPVAVGHSDVQTVILNHRNPYAAVCGRSFLSQKGAMEAVKSVFASEYPVSCVIDGIDYISPDEDVYGAGCMAYIVSAAAMNGGHVADERKFAVGLFDDIMWEMDFSSDKWNVVTDGTGFFSDLPAAYDNGALGRVLLEPGEYETWRADPVVSTEISSGSGLFLAGAIYDNTEISILHGRQAQDGSFETDSVLYRVTLNAGEWVKVCCDSMPEADPDIAVEFAAGFDKGTFLYFCGRDSIEKCGRMQYAFSDTGLVLQSQS